MKNQKIKFSVLMSVYSKEKPENLSKAIESIINQTLKPDEFVIVKDGPLSLSLNKIIENYKKQNSIIKVVSLDKNVGLGRALNEGIKECTNQYIARMDSDDISVEDRFEKQIDFISKNMEYDVFGGDLVEFDDSTNKIISKRTAPKTSLEIEKYIKKRNPMNHVSVIFKKDSVVEVGGYLDCLYFEDYYLWARMLKSGKKMINIDEILVKVRSGLDMSNRRGNLKYIKHIINFENKLLKLKIINIFYYIYNTFCRVLIAIAPNKLRYSIYQKKLRNKL